MADKKIKEIESIQFLRDGKWEDIDINQLRIIDKENIDNTNYIQDWFITLIITVVIILVVIILL